MNLIEDFAHPIIYASGWTIVHSTWQILLLFVLWLIVKQFTTNASFPVKYHLSLAALITSFVIVVANFVRHYSIYRNAKELTGVEIPDIGLVTTAEPMYIIESKPMLSNLFDENSIMVIFWFYVIGMLLYASITMADHFRLKSMVRNAWQVSDQWQQTMIRLSRELGIRDPQLYAKAILQLEELRTQQSKLAVAASQSKFHLLQRIKNIMTIKTHKSNPAHKIAGIILIVTALVSVAWINPALSINSRIDKVAPETDNDNTFVPAPEAKDSVKTRKKVTTVTTTSTTDSLPEPTSIIVNNKSVAWADLDEELKQEIIESMKEARIAIAEAGRSIDKAEMEATLNAVKAELREAAQELKIQLEQVDSEEFKKEMENVKITIKRLAEETRPMIDSLMPVVLSAFEVAKEAALYSIIYLEDLLETATEE